MPVAACNANATPSVAAISITAKQRPHATMASAKLIPSRRAGYRYRAPV